MDINNFILLRYIFKVKCLIQINNKMSNWLPRILNWSYFHGLVLQQVVLKPKEPKVLSWAPWLTHKCHGSCARPHFSSLSIPPSSCIAALKLCVESESKKGQDFSKKSQSELVKNSRFWCPWTLELLNIWEILILCTLRKRVQIWLKWFRGQKCAWCYSQYKQTSGGKAILGWSIWWVWTCTIHLDSSFGGGTRRNLSYSICYIIRSSLIS